MPDDQGRRWGTVPPGGVRSSDHGTPGAPVPVRSPTAIPPSRPVRQSPHRFAAAPPRTRRGPTQEQPVSPSFADLGVPQPIARVLDGPWHRRAVPHPDPPPCPTPSPAATSAAGPPPASGKTLAFGIPLAARVTNAAPKRPKALVLVPTRELAAQVARRAAGAAGADGPHASTPSTAASASAPSSTPCARASTSSSPAPAAWPTSSSGATCASTGSASWWSTRPTAWPTWASSPRSGACSTR